MMIKCEHCHALFTIPNHKFKDYIESTMFCEYCGKLAKFVFRTTLSYDPRMVGELVDIDGSKDEEV